MKGIRPRFLFWCVGLVALFLLANTKLRPFPHILVIFWLLLPLLSFLFSHWQGRCLSIHSELDPVAISYGQDAVWILHLENHSKLMPFLLRFSLPMKSKKDRVEVMLHPGEKKAIEFRYRLDVVGNYIFEPKHLLFEDLLGFFLLPYSGAKEQARKALALPVHQENTDRRMAVFRVQKEKTGERASLTEVTDDVFSIDPIRRGESLKHAHWKLSARMGDWMIRHYSDYANEPYRFLVDPISLEQPLLPYFYGMVEDTTNGKASQERSDFLNLFFDVVLDALSAGNPVDVGDRTSEVIHLHQTEDSSILGNYLARMPIEAQSNRWKLGQPVKHRQQLWIQRVDEITFGSLLEYQKLGFDFIVVSEKHQHTKEMADKISHSSLMVQWIEEVQ